MNRFSKEAIASVMGVALSGVAVGQDCEMLAGTTIESLSFDEALKAVSAAPAAKDEFETTAQYQARLENAGSVLPSRLVINAPLDRQYINYNADKGIFEIQSYAINNINTEWSAVMAGSPYEATLEVDRLFNLELVLGISDVITGTHTGQNSYGAQWEIAEVDRTVEAVFERKAPEFGGDLLQKNLSESPPTWEIAVPVEQARAMKEQMRGAVVIAPKAPFFFHNSGRTSAKVTPDNPMEVTQISKIIVADIQCLVLTDGENKVLLVRSTN